MSYALYDFEFPPEMVKTLNLKSATSGKSSALVVCFSKAVNVSVIIASLMQ